MLIVTIAALVMAASLGWFAYRLLQEEQRRSEARVAVLSAALDAGPVAAPQPVDALDLRFTRRSIPVPDIVVVEDDGRAMRAFPSEAGTTTAAPLAIDVPAAAVDHGHVPPADEAQAGDAGAGTDVRGAGLFADVPEARPADARGLIAVAGIGLVGLLAAGYASMGTGSQVPAQETHAEASDSQPGAAPASAPAAATIARGVPLELVALRHERAGDTLVVRGQVRNPVSGSDRMGVLARVTLLDAAGAALGDASVPLGAARLRPGTDTAFTVQAPSGEAVRRYRVTFRTPDGALVAHVDRR